VLRERHSCNVYGNRTALPNAAPHPRERLGEIAPSMRRFGSVGPQRRVPGLFAAANVV